MNVPNIIVKKPVLQPERIEVRDEGENVVFKVGNSEMRIHYEDALTISGWMRMAAKRAKATAGDNSRSWRVLADISNAAQAKQQ